MFMEESWHHERKDRREAEKHLYEIILCHGFKLATIQEGPFIGLYSEDWITFNF
jgi:hypothetical protein